MGSPFVVIATTNLKHTHKHKGISQYNINDSPHKTKMIYDIDLQILLKYIKQLKLIYSVVSNFPNL